MRGYVVKNRPLFVSGNQADAFGAAEHRARDIQSIDERLTIPDQVSR